MQKGILAIDIGSSSIRCCIYEVSPDNAISRLNRYSRSKQMKCVQPTTGKIPMLDILTKVDECIDSTLAQIRNDAPIEIKGVGISTFVQNFIGVDENGGVLEEATLSYACQVEEVAQESRSLRESMDQETFLRLYESTGACFAHSSYALPQLRHFYTTTSRNVYKWQSIASLLLCRWTGYNHLPISYSEASWTGLFRFETGRWEDEILSSWLCRECIDALPEVMDTNDISLAIEPTTPNNKTNPYWERWPELRASRLFLGMGDGACANIGSKCTHTSPRIAVTIGTSAAVRICHYLPISSKFQGRIPFGLFCYRVDKHSVLIGGALTDGGSVMEWIRSLLKLEDGEDFDRALSSIYTRCDEGRRRPVVLPFLGGERSTGYRDGATGCIYGLTRDTTTLDIVRSCLESVILRIHKILYLLHTAVDDRKGTIVATGAALQRNAQWRQMLSDCTGLHVVLDEESGHEGTCRGAAKFVSMALAGGYEEEEDLVVVDECIPNGSEVVKKQWVDSSVLQEKLIESLSHLW